MRLENGPRYSVAEAACPVDYCPATDLLWQGRKPYSAMGNKPNLKTVSDDELRQRLTEFLRQSRRAEADLVAHIAEFDARRLYAREATSSMFVWCTEVLGLSEQEAYLRIAVARASREHPMVLEMLRDGRLHLSGIALLARHLTPENREGILKRAAGMPHRQLKELAAEMEPKPDAPATIRKLPARRAEARASEARPPEAHGNASQLCTYRVESSTAEAGMARGTSPGGDEGTEGLRRDGAGSSPTRPATVEPLAPARFKVQFTADATLRDKLEKLQALMRSSVPGGDLARIIDVAVTEKLERLEARRFAKTKAPRKRVAETDTRPSSRRIPAAVRRVVHERDGGRCAYRDRRGKRCSKRHDLEFHHRQPFGQGGDHRPENLALMCRAHNTLLAEGDYGKGVMARFRRSASRVSEPVAAYGAGARLWHGGAPPG